MRKFIISAFITSSFFLTAIFGLNEDGKVEEPKNFNTIPSDQHGVEDIFIDNFEFVNLEELKSSSTGLIRMSDISEENLMVTGDIHKIEENADNLDINLQWADSSEDILID